MNADAQRQLDPEGTRAAILDAAHALFVAQGFAATSMATIAKQAGVTKSLIHHHFGSKRELWEAVKLRALGAYHQEQSALFQQQKADLALIEASILAYFRFLQRNPDVVRIVSWMAVEGDETCSTILIDLTQQGLELIRQGQRDGLLRSDVDASFILAPFFTLVRGWFTERPLLRDCVGEIPDQVADEAYLRAVLKIYLQGLLPPEGLGRP